MPVVTEIVDARDLELFAQYADILQIGSRNMQNFSLLTAVGKINRPVVLKRGFACTVTEWLTAADYILAEGNSNVILCEGGSVPLKTVPDSHWISLLFRLSKSQPLCPS